MLQKKLKLLKNEAGLTLVELLAVIVILGVIAAIAVPTIGGLVQDTKVKADVQTEDLIKDAAERYAYLTQSTPADGTELAVTVSELVTKGYLKAAPKRQADGKVYTGLIVKYMSSNGSWEYKTNTINAQ